MNRWTDSAVLAIAAALSACSGFRPAQLPDGATPVADTRSGPDAAGSDGAATDTTTPPDGPTGACAPGLAAPTIESFAVTDRIAEVALSEPISLAATATGPGPGPLVYGFAVDPPGDAVQNNGDGTARWALTTAPTNFHSTEFSITVTVGYRCEDGPTASAAVKVVVLGNLLVGDSKHGAIEAVGSGGQLLGQLLGPADLTSPSSLLLLGNGLLAVGDSGPRLVKIVDLAQRKVVGSFGSDAPDLKPWFLALTAGNELLVAPVDKNKIARYDLQGNLQQLITAPHPYGVAGLAVRDDGKIIAGISGSGRQYAFAADGTSEGLFADPPDTADTNSLLAIANNQLLLGARNDYNRGKLVLIDASGAVVKAVPENPSLDDSTYHHLVRFRDGYLFLDYWDPRIFAMSLDLAFASQPFATLPGADTWPMGIVWLHSPQ